MSAELLTDQNESLRPIRSDDYVAGIEAYLADAAQEQVLRPHQTEIFQDIEKFLAEGGTRGFVTSPTGTGKTVIFVELSKALLEAKRTAGRAPKIAVVEPTKDLVHQTLGRSQKKGYGKFAPDVKVVSFFSDASEEEKLEMDSADVVITTYDSFQIMDRRQFSRQRTAEEIHKQLETTLENFIPPGTVFSENIYEQLIFLQEVVSKIGQVSTGRKMLDIFDVFIFDEAHNLMGAKAAEIVESLDKDKLVIGFTATPDANEKRRLDQHLPTKIHDLTFLEAESMGLLSPVTNIGIKTNAKIKGGDLFSQEGDYRDEKLAYLINTEGRNRLIVNVAQVLIEHGFGTLIPCIAGQGALHARVLADMLNQAEIRAAAIYGDIPTKQRNNYYEQFELGKIDALTNIRILGEGWDSDRAKASIEASPTRSLIRKRQRIGRIVRPGGISIVVDLLDDYDPFNPPLHLPDILDGNDLPSGKIFGDSTPENQRKVASVMEALGDVAIVSQVVPAAYSRWFDTLANYEPILKGRIKTSRRGQYATPETLSPRYYNLDDEMLMKLFELSGQKPDAVLGRSNNNIRALFNIEQAQTLLRQTPICAVDLKYVDTTGEWISAQGFVKGFQNKYPNVTTEYMQERLDELGDSVNWRPIRSPIESKSRARAQDFHFYKAYKADRKTIASLSVQLENFFAIMART